MITINKYGTEDQDDDQSCKLMDGFAILVQLSLAFTALLTLIYKRWKETPQRPLQIWALDVSKQFIGAALIHFTNIAISDIAGKPGRSPTTNRCVWYFLNVAVDTTVGVFVLWSFFQLILVVLEKCQVVDKITTGEYGPPPLMRRLRPWICQLVVFLFAEVLTKLFLYVTVINIPWLFIIADLCIGWTKGDTRYQVVFVMLIFPLIMNAIQFWLTDMFLKVETKSSGQKAEKEAQSKSFISPMFVVLVEQNERTPLVFYPHKNDYQYKRSNMDTSV